MLLFTFIAPSIFSNEKYFVREQQTVKTFKSCQFQKVPHFPEKTSREIANRQGEFQDRAKSENNAINDVEQISSNGVSYFTKSAEALDSVLHKDVHWENIPSNKTKTLTESMNMRLWEIGTLNQLFIRSSNSEIKSLKN